MLASASRIAAGRRLLSSAATAARPQAAASTPSFNAAAKAGSGDAPAAAAAEEQGGASSGGLLARTFGRLRGAKATDGAAPTTTAATAAAAVTGDAKTAAAGSADSEAIRAHRALHARRASEAPAILTPAVMDEEHIIRRTVINHYRSKTPLVYQDAQGQSKTISESRAAKILKQTRKSYLERRYAALVPRTDLDVRQTVREIVNEIAPIPADAKDAVWTSRAFDSQTERVQILARCVETFQRDIPDHLLSEMKNAAGVVKFFKSPLPAAPRLFPSIDLEKLPPNLRIEV
ncbi:hypothetical protein CAOG_00989 [Capsaspora owczarzaki ATCC 30864]|uniref:Uncharacterized protein n=1 Tax=Capsaspora owczarzaki (strain ATCC 30864) TaxID=595528 RepID=A0A0D2WI91_CAPO3|nr:hypothetical protein CAOG_00989 [Capsaspora owczarzaki ATCC 30864]KJE89540.1 hypothetical protein CAOG_000989 [Capsaspora owczarzaki ATCC 30864]|eukprot:XP_004365860.1 hypothetical protein CAOG_00989 [Capsaspora owczarzaki ATCC 30864]